MQWDELENKKSEVISLNLEMAYLKWKIKDKEEENQDLKRKHF